MVLLFHTVIILLEYYPLNALHLHMQRYIYKTPLAVQFTYLGNEEMCCTFKACCTISVLFSTKCCSFHTFIFFCQKKKFFVCSVQKFEYQSCCLHGNIKYNSFAPPEVPVCHTFANCHKLWLLLFLSSQPTVTLVSSHLSRPLSHLHTTHSVKLRVQSVCQGQ